MPLNDKLLKSALNFDALDVAQLLTGKSYKDDEATGSLGMLLQMSNSELLKEKLSKLDDIHFGSLYEDHLRISKDLGFEIIYDEIFHGEGYDNQPIDEQYHILWHPQYGILCSSESYQNKKLNSSKWLFAFKPYSYMVDSFYGLRLGGSWFCTDNNFKNATIYMANWDAREAVRVQMNSLLNHGSFVLPWPEPQMLQLNTYMDWKKCEGYDYTEANIKRIDRFNKLPVEIQISVGGGSNRI